MRGNYKGDVRVHSKTALDSGNVTVLFGCATGMFSGIFSKENAEKLQENNFYRVDVEIESTKSNKPVAEGQKPRWFSNIKTFDWEKFEKSASQNQAL